MATATCGSVTINYDDSCSFKCDSKMFSKTKYWTVTCNGKTIAGGPVKDPDEQPPPKPHFPWEPGEVVVAGKLEQLAMALSNEWDRPLTVPPDLKDAVLPPTSPVGSMEEIAVALGLKLG